jgi:5,10-methylenetetrahydromethanopterin reductase
VTPPAVGVIAHLENPSVADTTALARTAEQAGADWLGVADAFWWRDSWMLLSEAARVTDRIILGPMVTNPYLRHPFQTVAALATLQELAGTRVQLGLAAGGSEISGAAHISRHDSAARIVALASLLRTVAAGGPLDAESGRRLDVPLAPVPIVVAGRGAGVLRAAGQCADAALLWAVPDSDLDWTIEQIGIGARQRAESGGPDLIWAPLVVHHEADRDRARVIAAYGLLNARPALRAAWGVGDDLVADVRRALVAGGAAAASHLVPPHVVDDIAIVDPDPRRLAGRARAIGASQLAFPAPDIESVPARVEWARAVLDASHAAR